MLTHIDLFSGIGGFSLAAGWAGFRTVAFVEIDPYCQAVLRKHWPEVPIIGDIREFKWPMADTAKDRSTTRFTDQKDRKKGKTKELDYGREVTLLTGGFPCQPFSVAGKRRGTEDDRHLWPQMFRVIKEVRPRWVLGENVAGFVRMALDDSLADLESIGYSTQAFVIPACAVNAPHRRDRVWIVAHSSRQRWGRRGDGDEAGDERALQVEGPSPADEQQDVADTEEGTERAGLCEKDTGREWRGRPSNGNWWAVEPDVGRVAHGVPSRVDRLKSLGNAIVPQVAYQIIKAIAEIEMNGNIKQEVPGEVLSRRTALEGRGGVPGASLPTTNGND